MTVIATLPSDDPGALRVPPNGRAERFVPHGPILARASVAITHGGMGVTQKALAAGVPVVAVPFGRDQPEVARRVEVAGAGVRLPRARLRPETLRAAVATAMDRRAGALAVAEGYRAAGGPEAAASHLEAMLGGTHPVTSLGAAGRLPSFRTGWDRRNPWTLHFVDPELERTVRGGDGGAGSPALPDRNDRRHRYLDHGQDDRPSAEERRVGQEQHVFRPEQNQQASKRRQGSSQARPQD